MSATCGHLVVEQYGCNNCFASHEEIKLEMLAEANQKHLQCVGQALAEWNKKQPAWLPVLKYEDLTPAQQSEIDLRVEELEREAL